MLPHYLVKVETPKMHVNTNSAFNLPFGCGLGWSKGTTSSIVFAKWRQCARWHCRDLCKNGWADRFAAWIEDYGGSQRSTSWIVFARWRQCALAGRHIGATWRMQLNWTVRLLRRCGLICQNTLITCCFF